jgi:DNA-binding beta-propeller fold protein YncE
VPEGDRSGLLSNSLRVRARLPNPPGRSGAFDHGDVDPVTGRVFVAHSDFGTVDVIDPGGVQVAAVIEGCPDGSGVLCSGTQRLVFAASRAAGKVLLIDPDRLEIIRDIAVGPKPNGLAWDGGRGRLLVADVDPSDQAARLSDVSLSELVALTPLPGRPRWCVFDDRADRFLINIREPASLISLSGSSGAIAGSWPISSAGPHGLDLDRDRGRAFVACDGARVIVVDLASGKELSTIAISGEPDAIWFNPRRQRLYVGIGDPGLIDVVDTGRARLVESIPTEPGAKTSAFDVERQQLYVFLPRSCATVVLEQT